MDTFAVLADLNNRSLINRHAAPRRAPGMAEDRTARPGIVRMILRRLQAQPGTARRSAATNPARAAWR